MKKKFLVFVAILSVLLPTVGLQSASASTMSYNYVNVASCREVSNGIYIRRTAGSYEYKLQNGVKDTGHGMRDYGYYCSSNTQYRVNWIEVNANKITRMSAYDMASNELINSNEYGFQRVGWYQYANAVTLDNNVNTLKIDASSYAIPGQNAYVAFAYTSSENYNNVAFNQYNVASILQASQPTFSYSAYNQEMQMNITDLYRGKYMIVLALVNNGDGVSQISGMPAGVEVDDISHLLFYLEPQDVLPLGSCGNSADGDGLYAACIGDTIFHNSGLQVRVDNFVDNYGDYNDYLKVSLKNANTTSLEFHQVGESQYVRLNNGSRYRPWYKITYEGPSNYYSNVMEISIERL